MTEEASLLPHERGTVRHRTVPERVLGRVVLAPRGVKIMKHEVIGASFEVRWLAPVWVRVGNGLPQIVRGPKDALEQLKFRWPSLQGSSYQEAKLKCMAALTKPGLCEEARETFIRASIEAKMLD
jgi:hypothetical protein